MERKKSTERETDSNRDIDTRESQRTMKDRETDRLSVI